jgi:hypothetical protein
MMAEPAQPVFKVDELAGATKLAGLVVLISD